jgi:RNA exonuclease 1
MLKTLYDHFVVLYHDILPLNPALASDHALKQEEEVYNKSSKMTYRNVSVLLPSSPHKGQSISLQAIIQCAGALKRRPVPDSLSHTSVGTESELLARAESRKTLDSLRLTYEILEPYVLSISDLVTWGYFVQIPEGTGGDNPSQEGKVAKCERCTQPFLVKRQEEADECIYHWGKPYTTKINGEILIASSILGN